MDKHEILEKSRKDNGPIDERSKVMEYRMNFAMVATMLLVWAALFFWDVFRGQDTSVGGAIMLSGVAAMCFCRFRQLGMKSMLAFGLLAAFGAVSFAVRHIALTI